MGAGVYDIAGVPVIDEDGLWTLCELCTTELLLGDDPSQVVAHTRRLGGALGAGGAIAEVTIVENFRVLRQARAQGAQFDPVA
ncbi:hypothetical protein [Blastococcus mobilis]|uniref:hypothetical protein n=1 Tax=Blastococcus mobilis TaxID=1938746 RepID=UPI000B76BB72|nr:hypothetical protein [Blastococcus mobilis]